MLFFPRTSSSVRLDMWSLIDILMNRVSMHKLGLSPLVTIETRCHQPSTSHRAELPIYFRYSCMGLRFVVAHKAQEHFTWEKVPHSLAQGAVPRDRLVVNAWQFQSNRNLDWHFKSSNLRLLSSTHSNVTHLRCSPIVWKIQDTTRSWLGDALSMRSLVWFIDQKFSHVLQVYREDY